MTTFCAGGKPAAGRREGEPHIKAFKYSEKLFNYRAQSHAHWVNHTFTGRKCVIHENGEYVAGFMFFNHIHSILLIRESQNFNQVWKCSSVILFQEELRI